MKMRLFALFAGLLLVVSMASFAASARADFERPGKNSREIADFSYKVDESVWKALGESKRADVIVGVNVDLGGDLSDGEISEKVYDFVSKNRVDDSNNKDWFSAGLSAREIRRLSKDRRVDVIVLNGRVGEALETSTQIIGATDVWNMDVGGQNLDGFGSTICVIDGSFNLSHPDFAGRNALGEGNVADCTVNGGCPISSNAQSLSDTGHGTHVLGIAAASGGINGVAKGADFIAARTMKDDGEIKTSDLMKGIQWCGDNVATYGIDAISISLVLEEEPTYAGFCDAQTNPFLVWYVDTAVAAGIPVVSATGNDGVFGVRSPACIQSAIPVAGTDDSDNKAGFANYNNNTRLFAPGVDINSTKANGWGYEERSGTSMSTPHVAGSIAIIKQVLDLTSGNMSVSEIKNLLFDTGEQVNGLSFDLHRRISLVNAVNSLLPPACPADLNGDGTVNVLDLIVMLGEWGPNPGSQSDLNGDGTVNVLDLIQMLSEWGSCTESGGTESAGGLSYEEGADLIEKFAPADEVDEALGKWKKMHSGSSGSVLKR